MASSVGKLNLKTEIDNLIKSIETTSDLLSPIFIMTYKINQICFLVIMGIFRININYDRTEIDNLIVGIETRWISPELKFLRGYLINFRLEFHLENWDTNAAMILMEYI